MLDNLIGDHSEEKLKNELDLKTELIKKFHWLRQVTGVSPEEV
jgi:hypothetical protein